MMSNLALSRHWPLWQSGTRPGPWPVRADYNNKLGVPLNSTGRNLAPAAHHSTIAALQREARDCLGLLSLDCSSSSRP